MHSLVCPMPTETAVRRVGGEAGVVLMVVLWRGSRFKVQGSRLRVTVRRLEGSKVGHSPCELSNP